MTETTLDLGTREDGSPHSLPLTAFDCHAQFIAPTRYGKTRAMALITQQLIKKRDAAFVVIDPKGDLYDLMKGWAYEQHLDHRLLLLDVRQSDQILGFNPLKPHWSLGPEEQANLQFDILANVLGIGADQQTAVLTHQRERWMRNALLALIHARLTYCEAAQLLDPTNGALRDAVIPHLPPSDTLGEFRELQRQTVDRNPTALRAVQNEVGHSITQFKRLTASSTLRRMYANDRTIDFRRLFDDRQILLVRLAPDKNVIDLPHQKLLGMQIVNEVIREAFGRSPADRVQTYCVIDEAGRFATKDVTEVLEQGGSYKLSLFLAHQQCSQLTSPRDHDRTFLDSVLTNAQIKLVGGGLAPPDAQEIGDTIYRHLIDPDKPFLATATKRQLQEVVEVTSVSEGVQEAHAHTAGDQWSRGLGRVSTTGTSISRGRHRSGGQSVNDAGGSSVTVDPVTGLPTVTTSASRSAGSSSAEGDDESDGLSESESDIDMETEGGFTAETSTRGRSSGRTTGPAVHPTEVFEEFQPEPLDTQQHRFTSKMIRLQKRHFLTAVMKDEPIAFRVADVPDPEWTAGQIEALDEQIAARNREHYSSPTEIEAMIVGRQQRLLSHAIVVDDPSAQPVPSPSSGLDIETTDTDALPERPQLKERLRSKKSR